MTILLAGAELDTRTEEGQRVIRVEQRRRGLEDPVERAMRAGRQDDRAAIASVRAKSAPLYSRDSPRTLASA